MCLVPRSVGALLLVLMAMICLARPARADIRLLGDWTYSFSTSESEDLEMDEVTESESQRLRQLYRLDFSRRFFPTLLVNGGMLFERSDLDSETDGVSNEITGEVLRPYVDAELGNNLYTLGGGYRQSEITNSGAGLTTTRQNVEEYYSRAEWNPVNLPAVEAHYTHTLRSTEPETTDQESRVYRLTTSYDYRQYEFLYNYLRSESEESIEDTNSISQTHNGRLLYSNAFLNRRVTVNARIQAERAAVEFSGSGERLISATSPGAGFFRLDDVTPATNIPGDFTSVTGADASFADVDLGGGGGSNPVSVGLAFSDAVTVDRLRVLLDTGLDELSRQRIDRIEGEWSWRVFVSDDQQVWDELPVTLADYDPIENYFEIRFPQTAEVEFIKVVTTPVARDPLSGDLLFPIPVAGLRPLFSLTPDQGDEIVSIARNLNFGVGWKITDRTRVGYELSYQDQEVDAFAIKNRQLYNAANINHLINRVFSTSARFMRNDRWEQGRHEDISHQITAQIAALYLPTLNQSATYSGKWTEEPEGKSTSHSVFLRTTAELYPGWDVAFDQGYSWQEQAEQGVSESFFLRLGNSIVPHPRLNLIADYTVRWTWQEDREDRRDQTSRVRAFWAPTDTLSLLGEVRLRDTAEATFVEWEYGAGWLPFRDGTLQFNIRYNEEGNNEDDRSRSLSPSLQWKIFPNADLTLTYSRGMLKDQNEDTNFQSMLANLRIFYN